MLRAAGAKRRGRQDAETPGQDSRFVGQDVAEQVLRDDDVEVGRAADEQHRARIDQLVVEHDVGVLGRDLIGHGSPQARGGQHVRLVNLGHLAAPGPREIERQTHDPGDLALVVGKRVEGGPLARRAGRLATIAEVDPAGQLAHDDHVDAHQELRTDR